MNASMDMSTPTMNVQEDCGHATSYKAPTAFRADDFDPQLPVEYGDAVIVTFGKGVYYPALHLFVSQVQSIAKLRGNAVTMHLHTCLRGSALPATRPNRHSEA